MKSVRQIIKGSSIQCVRNLLIEFNFKILIKFYIYNKLSFHN